LGISENRKDELNRRWFFEDTQRASEVLRRRIRELREARFPSQVALAKVMTDVGAPLTGDKVSKIEKGRRAVALDELLAFSYVLDVPLVQLVSPLDGEPPIRAGDIGLDRYEVGNWIVWGNPRRVANFTGRTRVRLAREIATMAQVVADETDPKRRAQQGRKLMRVVERLRKNMNIPPGVIKRQALRDEMESAQSADESPTASA
jgi:transcriptional regulator with XRE-family HTH domain